MKRNIEEIFNSIKYNEGRLPKEELQELISRKDETKVFLIDYMRDFKENYKEALDDLSYFGHIYATYLLAEFRQEEFYDIYLDILELPNNVAISLYDDAIKEHGGKIIASIYNKDDSRLIEMIQSEDISKDVKCAVKDAFEIIQSDNPIYIKSIFDEVSNWECFKEESKIEGLEGLEGLEDDSLNNLIANELKKGIDNFIMKNTTPAKLGRNDLCICGSKKKYKRCCGK